MTFFNVDDNLNISDKWLKVPRKERMAAAGVFVFAGSYCAHNLTDGAVPVALVEELPNGTRLAQLLVDADIWRRNGQGYKFTNWSRYNPTRAEVLESRAKNAERSRRYRRNRTSESDEPRE